MLNLARYIPVVLAASLGGYLSYRAGLFLARGAVALGRGLAGALGALLLAPVALLLLVAILLGMVAFLLGETAWWIRGHVFGPVLATLPTSRPALTGGRRRLA